jgi:hypothetical protein
MLVYPDEVGEMIQAYGHVGLVVGIRTLVRRSHDRHAMMTLEVLPCIRSSIFVISRRVYCFGVSWFGGA